MRSPSQDNTQGSIYISGGTFDITAASDAIQGTTTVVIDGGTFTLAAGEGIEGTNVTINDGTINISASDDGINATNKSSEKVCITINGGNITINMGQGDTDGLDSNGDLTITGGTINITGQSACDYDGQAQKTGGTLIVNGVETDTIPNQAAWAASDSNTQTATNFFINILLSKDLRFDLKRRSLFLHQSFVSSPVHVFTPPNSATLV